jgi:dihydroorotase
MPLYEVVKCATRKPAQLIGLADEIGTLRPGACADASLLALQQTPVQLSDAGWDVPVETVVASERLVPVGVVRAGELIFFNPSDQRSDADPDRS